MEKGNQMEEELEDEGIQKIDEFYCKNVFKNEFNAQFPEKKEQQNRFFESEDKEKSGKWEKIQKLLGNPKIFQLISKMLKIQEKDNKNENKIQCNENYKNAILFVLNKLNQKPNMRKFLQLCKSLIEKSSPEKITESTLTIEQIRIFEDACELTPKTSQFNPKTPSNESIFFLSTRPVNLKRRYAECEFAGIGESRRFNWFFVSTEKGKEKEKKQGGSAGDEWSIRGKKNWGRFDGGFWDQLEWTRNSGF